MKTTAILIITSLFANAQAFEWAEHLGGTGDNYTTGHFTEQ